MHTLLPAGHNAAWLTVFTLETILYAVGTAFIVMLMVKDHHVHELFVRCRSHDAGMCASNAEPLLVQDKRRGSNKGDRHD